MKYYYDLNKEEDILIKGEKSIGALLGLTMVLLGGIFTFIVVAYRMFIKPEVTQKIVERQDKSVRENIVFLIVSLIIIFISVYGLTGYIRTNFYLSQNNIIIKEIVRVYNVDINEIKNVNINRARSWFVTITLTNNKIFMLNMLTHESAEELESKIKELMEINHKKTH